MSIRLKPGDVLVRTNGSVEPQKVIVDRVEDEWVYYKTPDYTYSAGAPLELFLQMFHLKKIEVRDTFLLKSHVLNPWNEHRLHVQVTGLKDGWVRYETIDGYYKNAFPEATFLELYAPVHLTTSAQVAQSAKDATET